MSKLTYIKNSIFVEEIVTVIVMSYFTKVTVMANLLFKSRNLNFVKLCLSSYNTKIPAAMFQDFLQCSRLQSNYQVAYSDFEVK